jgi:hypothetical protein
MEEFCRRLESRCQNFYSKTRRLVRKPFRRHRQGSTVASPTTTMPTTTNPTTTKQTTNRQVLPENLDSPFMRLPTELRLLIYSHLIPDMLVTTTEEYDKNTKARLRRDKEPCCPALLCTNRKIYHELVKKLYSSIALCIRLESGSLRFANQAFPMPLSLPFGFRFLRRLDLTVRFIKYGSLHSLNQITKYKTEVDQKEALQHLTLLEEISNYFSPSGHGTLQDLKLYIVCGPFYFRSQVLGDEGHDSLSAPEQQSLIRASLKLNLHPLRNIRVSGSVRVIEIRGGVSNLGCFGNVKGDLIKIKQQCFKRLESKIIGAYDWPGASEDSEVEYPHTKRPGRDTAKYTEQEIDENILSTFGGRVVRVAKIG